MQTIQSYLTPLQNAARNPQSVLSRGSQTAASATDTAVNNPQSFLTRLRNLDSATLTQVGIVTAETIGFFSIGEMLGKFKIVGYRSEAPAHH
jgi:F-type H+-transporting ATPase subunit g